MTTCHPQQNFINNFGDITEYKQAFSKKNIRLSVDDKGLNIHITQLILN